MPLSEHDQRLLDEMERHLLAHDADVVSAPRQGQTLSYRNIVIGSVLVLVGIGGLIAGVATSLIVVGVIAFVVMGVGVVLAVTPSKNGAASSQAPRQGATRPQGAPSTSSSFMDRMNDRWDRRNDER